jgi:hypothetical protein
MFTLPSIPNLIISTLVFFIVAWYANRHLDEQSIPKGITRGLLVFVLASAVSWGAGEAVDWSQGTQPEVKTSGDLSQLMKAVDQ